MKKATLLITAITLCFALFFIGCSQDSSEADTKGDNTAGILGRVLCLNDDGIIVWIENIGNVYVKHVDGTLGIEPLDTVVMEFSKDNLEPANEKFVDYFGEEQTYSFILERPESIRHNTADEPTFG